MWASFIAIFRKEFLHIRRDRSVLVMALTVPLFQLVLFGFIEQTARDLPTVVADQDMSRFSREFQDKLQATRTFKITQVTTNPDEARRAITAGAARVGILIPPEFHRDRARGQGAKVLVLIDGSDSMASSQALSAINGVAADESLKVLEERLGSLKPAPALSTQPILLFNPDGRTANYIIPGLVCILLQIVTTVLTAVSIVRERERGTLEQLLVTPVHPLGLMLGKLVPYMFVGMMEATVILSAMRFGFDVPIRGNLVFLAVMCLIYLFALLAMGLFVSTRASSQLEAQQMAQLFFLPSVFLSGYIFPASGLPRPLYYIGRLMPATHMIEVMRGIVLRDAGPMDLWVNVASLLAISLVLVWMSVRRFQKIAV